MLNTCKCEVVRTSASGAGWTLDPERNMWVCGSCRKPSPFHFGFSYSYSKECCECGTEYTSEVMPDPMMLCKDCA